MNQKIKDFSYAFNHDCNIGLLCHNELIISCFHKLPVVDYFIYNTVHKVKNNYNVIFECFNT